MKYKEIVIKCIEYIEVHIKEELNSEQIANEMGYSLYHFARIFKEDTGMSIMEYVKERRLVCASKDIFEGKKIIDVALEYGYQTHSGFTQAFKKRFGFTPAVVHAMRMSCDVLEEKIDRAYKVAQKLHKGEKRKSGEEYITHSINVALILAEMEVNEVCIVAGLLHEVREKGDEVIAEEVRKEFGNQVIELIDAVTVFGNQGYSYDEVKGGGEKQVLLIKLADRLHNMRTIKYMESEKFKEKARETIEFFSPIAAKLGITSIKAELDDLAMQYIAK